MLIRSIFGDKYSYEDFKAAYDRLSQNIKEFTELKEMEYAAITHHEDVSINMMLSISKQKKLL